MEQFDLIVIGSGPAGQRAAIQAAKADKRVALIERRQALGGVSINTGTIPSKTMREAVLHFSGYRYKPIYGINYRVKEKITMPDLVFRVQHVIRTEIDVARSQLVRNGIEVLTGVASFIDPTHVAVTNSRGTTDYQASYVVIATGTKPATSPLVPINGRNIINSDQSALDAGDPEDPDRRGGRRDRRRICVHVRDSGRAGHSCREASAPAGVRR